MTYCDECLYHFFTSVPAVEKVNGYSLCRKCAVESRRASAKKLREVEARRVLALPRPVAAKGRRK